MTTSDPVLYPLPQTDAESIRQDAARARLDLADTVEALAARLNVQHQLFRKIRSAGRRAGPAWAAGAGAASVVILARLAAAGPGAARHRRWAAGGVVATAVSVLAYVAIDRRRGPKPQAQRGRQSAAIESTIPLPVPMSAPPVGPGPLPPNPAGRDVVDVLLDQHRQIDGMFAWVRSTEGVARREAFAALVEFLHRHERAEQEIVHPVLAALDGPGPRVAADRRDEEGEADRSIASLIRRSVNNSRFGADFDELHDQVRAHAAHEEAIEFPLLRARVPGDRLLTMANQVQAAQADPW